MKSKKNQYLLLGLVALIWGGVIYRFFSFTGSDEIDTAPIRISRGIGDIDTSRKQYAYYLDYPDPFLRRAPVRQVVKQPAPRPDRHDRKRYVPIPRIEFLGVIASGDSKTGIVQLDNRSVMVKAGEEVGGFKIISLSDDRIRVHYAEADSIMDLAPREKRSAAEEYTYAR